MINNIVIILAIYSICLRLLELAISKNNQNKLIVNNFHQTENKVVFSSMVLVHIFFYFFLFGELYFYPKNYYFLEVVSLIIFLLSQLLRFWSLSSLGKSWNVNIMTPREFIGVKIVDTGPYNYIRHPNYLVVILEFFSLPLVGSAIITSLVFSFLNALVLYWRINEEESHLFKIPDYQKKMLFKKRLIPGVF